MKFFLALKKEFYLKYTKKHNIETIERGFIFKFCYNAEEGKFLSVVINSFFVLYINNILYVAAKVL